MGDVATRARVYRAKAQEIRKILRERVVSHMSRTTLIAIAADYERLAARLEQRDKSLPEIEVLVHRLAR